MVIDDRGSSARPDPSQEFFVSHLVRYVLPNRMIAILMIATEVVRILERVTYPVETPPRFKPIMNSEFPWQCLTEQHTKSPPGTNGRSESIRRAV